MWHSEFFIIDNIPLARFSAYFVEVAAVAIILTWLYNRSAGSILMVVVVHAADNAVSLGAVTTTVVAFVAILQGTLLVLLELRAGRYGGSVLGEGSTLVPVTGAPDRRDH